VVMPSTSTRVVLAEDRRRRGRIKTERLTKRPWPLADHGLSQSGKDVDAKCIRRDGAVMGLVSLSSYNAPRLNPGRLSIQGLVCLIKPDKGR
jgi:hypothetical protein